MAERRRALPGPGRCGRAQQDVRVHGDRQCAPFPLCLLARVCASAVSVCQQAGAREWVWAQESM